MEEQRQRAYLEWVETKWPQELNRFLNSAMYLYEKNQPQKEDESNNKYELRYQIALSKVKARNGTCDFLVLDCIAAGQVMCFVKSIEGSFIKFILDNQKRNHKQNFQWNYFPIFEKNNIIVY